MSRTTGATLPIGHPAPHRDRISQRLLLLALAVPPLAWGAQLLLGFAASSYLCFPDQPRPIGAPVPAWLFPTLVAANAAALLCIAAVLLLALRLFSRTRDEHRDQPGGLFDAGEGRTRFLAGWAVVLSVIFLVATLFNSITLLSVTSCAT